MLENLNEKEKEIFESVKKACGFSDDKKNYSKVIEDKAKQSEVCFEMLKRFLKLESLSPVVFSADNKRYEKLLKACFEDLTYPENLKSVFVGKRIEGVLKLFQEERVLQSAPLAAILAACANDIIEISKINGTEINEEEPIYSDVLYAGLQALRLYFAATFDSEFSKVRAKSFISVNNALNGIVFKYRTKDGRDFSFHNYYESQKASVSKALGFQKESKDINMMTIEEDKIFIKNTVEKKESSILEDFVFDNGGSACIIRSREEWNDTEVGKAVNKMPLVKINKFSDAKGLKGKKLGGEKGPLEGLRVLDFTHIIAGPACSRTLAEYGADVRLVRRKSLFNQEQSFTELDGWAGKHAIDIDLNDKKSLDRVKELIKEADVVTYSYQNNAFERFGLTKEDIIKLNPNIIYSSMMCFSEEVWSNRPGWAPLAEDITGLSVRNGSKVKPEKLNGVPLDYIPGLILALGTLDAIKSSMKNGGGYTVMTSLTRGAVWLHECTDLWESIKDTRLEYNYIKTSPKFKAWDNIIVDTKGNATGDIGFPVAAVVSNNIPDVCNNFKFTDGEKDFLL